MVKDGLGLGLWLTDGNREIPNQELI